MNKLNANGQVLSETQMKEVKGGATYDIDLETLASGVLNFCMYCGNPFNGHYEFDDAGNVECQKCGCKNSIDDFEKKVK